MGFFPNDEQLRVQVESQEGVRRRHKAICTKIESSLEKYLGIYYNVYKTKNTSNISHVISHIQVLLLNKLFSGNKNNAEELWGHIIKYCYLLNKYPEFAQREIEKSDAFGTMTKYIDTKYRELTMRNSSHFKISEEDGLTKLLRED